VTWKKAGEVALVVLAFAGLLAVLFVLMSILWLTTGLAPG
jgi:hypothetical protein